MKHFVHIVLFTSLLTGCPESPAQGTIPAPPPQTQPAPAQTAPVVSAVIEAIAPEPEPPARVHVEQKEIPASQPTPPGQFNTWRTLADLQITASADLELCSIGGVCVSNDDGEAGRIMFHFHGSMVGIIDLAKLEDGVFVFELNPPLMLESGRGYPISIIVESTHDRGDTIQVEIRSIITDRVTSDTVFRWPAVRCGPK